MQAFPRQEGLLLFQGQADIKLDVKQSPNEHRDASSECSRKVEIQDQQVTHFKPFALAKKRRLINLVIAVERLQVDNLVGRFVKEAIQPAEE